MVWCLAVPYQPSQKRKYKTMSWTIVKDDFQFSKALSLAKGSYQRDVLLGRHSLSGSTLKGKARQYGGVYATSRANLIKRLVEHGVRVSEEIGSHNKRLLVIG
jgi:hypothetical protein